MNRDVLEVVDAAIALPIRVLLVQRGIFFLSRADTDDDIIVPSQIFFGMYCVKCDISAKVLSILSIASLFPRRRLWLVVMSLPPLPQDVEQRDWACYEIIIACRVQMQNKFYHRERSCLDRTVLCRRQQLSHHGVSCCCSVTLFVTSNKPFLGRI